MCTALRLGIALLIIYLLGASIWRLLSRPEPASGGASADRLFHEVFLGAAAVSWLGLALAEARRFGLAPYLIFVLLAALVGRLRRSPSSPSYSRSDALGAAIVMTVIIYLWPPFDTLLYGADSSVYQAGGIHLAQTGELVFRDTSVLSLPRAVRASLFPSQAADGVSPPYLRLPGGFILSDLDSPEVLPAFHHLMMVWTGLFVAVGGPRTASWPVVLFASLAFWSVYRFACAAGGRTTGLATIAILAVLFPQYWYSRFPMPEIATQFFLWAALCAYLEWQRSADERQALLAGLGLGMAVMMRTDQLIFLTVPFLWVVAFGRNGSRRQWGIFVAATLAPWLHALTHILTFRTHYFSILRGIVAEGGEIFAGGSAAPLLAAVTLIAATLYTGVRSFRSLLFCVAATATAINVFLLVRGGEWNVSTNIGYLVHYAGLPLLLAGLAGVRELGGRVGSSLFVVTLVTSAIHALVDPRAQPVPLWVARRFVPMLLPGLAILGALALVRWSHGRRILLAGGLVACMAVPAAHLLPLRLERFYPRVTNHVQVLSGILPRDSVLMGDKTDLLPSQIHAAIWALTGVPPYLIDGTQINQLPALAARLAPRPIYWLSTDRRPAVRTLGTLELQPIATYEFPFLSARFERYQAQLVGRQAPAFHLYRVHP
jgi:4-amino-4-deoxy-L-arabinose transferase-like glycosyltransferase